MEIDRSPKSREPRLPLDQVLNTAELFQRTSRAPEYTAESRALVALAKAMNEAPRTFLQKSAEMALELCHADSAGISMLEAGEDGRSVPLARHSRSLRA